MNVLKNEQTKNYDYLSRYSTVAIAYNSVDKKYVYKIGKHLKTTTEYSLHTLGQYDTLDSISLYYYGRPDYWWIIADFNRINDPFIKLQNFYKELKVPTISNLEYED